MGGGTPNPSSQMDTTTTQETIVDERTIDALPIIGMVEIPLVDTMVTGPAVVEIEVTESLKGKRGVKRTSAGIKKEKKPKQEKKPKPEKKPKAPKKEKKAPPKKIEVDDEEPVSLDEDEELDQEPDNEDITEETRDLIDLQEPAPLERTMSMPLPSSGDVSVSA